MQSGDVGLWLLRLHLPENLLPRDAMPFVRGDGTFRLGPVLVTPRPLKAETYEELEDGRERLCTYSFGRRTSHVILGRRSRELPPEHPEWN